MCSIKRSPLLRPITRLTGYARFQMAPTEAQRLLEEAAEAGAASLVFEQSVVFTAMPKHPWPTCVRVNGSAIFKNILELQLPETLEVSATLSLVGSQLCAPLQNLSVGMFLHAQRTNIKWIPPTVSVQHQMQFSANRFVIVFSKLHEDRSAGQGIYLASQTLQAALECYRSLRKRAKKQAVIEYMKAAFGREAAAALVDICATETDLKLQGWIINQLTGTTTPTSQRTRRL